MLPPPNVTGSLHMGHAFQDTLMDALTRYHRMRGDNTLWQPGTDHAGIATQMVVERQLNTDNMTRHDLGREAFIERIWEWKHQSGGTITRQLRRMGSSVDWSRERFTMDEGLSRAVRAVFTRLYDEGLIYKGDYIINWCPRCHTALADLEVEHEVHEGHLYHIRYPFTDGTGGVVVATTRPETMLGDTAVAVNPNDERYQGMESLQVILPLMNRTIPIIKDKYVDMSFGTGALKITPAHDPNDFEIGNHHNLERIKVIGDDGRMTSEAGKFKGLDRFECRNVVVNALKEEGLLEKIEPYQHSIGHCYRCRTIIEPNLSKQWFVRTQPLAKKAIDAVKKGDTKIIPEVWTKTYFEWMNNIKDWCISRQIWWGHQIPAWTCSTCQEIIVALDTPTACPACGGTDLLQDTDVLDTWFSSALWPFSTMGWPDQTPLLKLFYPTSVLVTGFDILFFWVARMMMMGIHFMKDVPFKDVYVHALVRDEEGKKMSKSTGNVIDPLSVIDRYGADAFRFTLAAFAAQGRDVKMSEKRVEGYRNFINKIWNAARFALIYITKSSKNITTEPLSLVDRWILSRLYRVSGKVSEGLESYRFNDAAGALYKFVWHEFCDWYLEAIKPILYEKEGQSRQQATLSVLWRVLHDTLVLLHPFVPFITEAIWQNIPHTGESIMTESFPEFDQDRVDRETENKIEAVFKVISEIRKIRSELKISPADRVKVSLAVSKVKSKSILEENREYIYSLGKVSSIEFKDCTGQKGYIKTTIKNINIFIYILDVVDIKLEINRIRNQMAKTNTVIEKSKKKISNPAFNNKAPAEIIQKEKDRLDQAEKTLKVLNDQLTRIEGASK